MSSKMIGLRGPKEPKNRIHDLMLPDDWWCLSFFSCQIPRSLAWTLRSSNIHEPFLRAPKRTLCARSINYPANLNSPHNEVSLNHFTNAMNPSLITNNLHKPTNRLTKTASLITLVKSRIKRATNHSTHKHTHIYTHTHLRTIFMWIQQTFESLKHSFDLPSNRTGIFFL